MKVDKTCQHCGTNYKSSSGQSRYCSTACRVFAYRKRHSIPEPAYIRKHKLPKKEIVEKREVKIKAITNYFQTILDEEKKITGLIEKLLKKKNNALRRLIKDAPISDIRINKTEKTNKQLNKIYKYSQSIADLEIEQEKIRQLKRKTTKFETVTKIIEVKVDVPLEETIDSAFAKPIELIKREVPLIYNSYKTITKRNSLNQKYKAINLLDEWSNYFGNPPIDFKCLFIASDINESRRFILRLTNYLAAEFGNVIWFNKNENLLKLVNAGVSVSASESLFVALREDLIQIKQTLLANRFEFVIFDHEMINNTGFIELLPILKNSAVIIIANTGEDFTYKNFNIVLDNSSGKINKLQ